MKITKSQLKRIIKEELDSVLSENTKPTTRSHMGLTAEVVRQLKYIVYDLETALKSPFPDPAVSTIVDDLEVQLEALKGAYTPAYKARPGYGGEPIERSEFRPHRDQEMYDKIEKHIYKKQNP